MTDPHTLYLSAVAKLQTLRQQMAKLQADHDALKASMSRQCLKSESCPHCEPRCVECAAEGRQG